MHSFWMRSYSKKERKVMGGGSRILKALFWVLVLVGVVWFLFAGILANRAAKTTATVMVRSTGNFKRWRSTGEVIRHVVHQDLNPIYVSKRRVPNGPDPIHNRKEVKSRQPPGRT